MPIHKDVKIGHAHLTVSDLEKSLAFYRDLLGFDVTAKIGDSAVFLSAGGYHHHIALNTWAGKGAKPAPAGHTGLYHFAILYPTRKELAKALKKLADAHYPLDGASDHGVSEAIYLRDPDNNGVELYVDRPQEQWKKDLKGEILMVTEPLDLENLMGELES
jgi:catechol 2,3-dioxygenase